MKEKDVLGYMKKEAGLAYTIEVAIKLGTFTSLGYASIEGKNICRDLERQINGLREKVEDPEDGLDAVLRAGPRKLTEDNLVDGDSYNPWHSVRLGELQKYEDKQYRAEVKNLESKKKKLDQLVLKLQKYQELDKQTKEAIQKLTQ